MLGQMQGKGGVGEQCREGAQGAGYIEYEAKVRTLALTLSEREALDGF